MRERREGGKPTVRPLDDIVQHGAGCVAHFASLSFFSCPNLSLSFPSSKFLEYRIRIPPQNRSEFAFDVSFEVGCGAKMDNGKGVRVASLCDS